MTQFFMQTPIWVWPLFILLLVAGLRARRDRSAPVVMLYCLPLLGVMGLRSVLAMSVALPVLAAFAVAFACGAGWAYRAQTRWTGPRDGRMIKLKGENLTLIAMMVTFFANFASGFLAAVAPDVATGLIFQVLFAIVLALASGSFAGRAIQIWQSGRDQQAV